MWFELPYERPLPKALHYRRPRKCCLRIQNNGGHGGSSAVLAWGLKILAHAISPTSLCLVESPCGWKFSPCYASCLKIVKLLPCSAQFRPFLPGFAPNQPCLTPCDEIYLKDRRFKSKRINQQNIPVTIFALCLVLRRAYWLKLRVLCLPCCLGQKGGRASVKNSKSTFPYIMLLYLTLLSETKCCQNLL